MFRLRQPFPMLPEALGHGASNMCAMMPERIASTDTFVGYAPSLEDAILPQVDDVIRACQEIVRF